MAFGESSFEKTLKKYKDIYCSELMKIVPVRECDRRDRHLGLDPRNDEHLNDDGMGNWPPEVVSYFDEVADDIKSRLYEIGEYFDETIDIFCSRSLVDLSSYIQKGFPSLYPEGDIYYSMPWFRIRKTGEYDPHDISEMFHIPFTKLEFTGNQRFSMTGQPYLYLAESIKTAMAEISAEPGNINAALFFPNYTQYYHKPIYNIENSFIKNLNVYVHLTESGSKLVYDNDFTAFSKKNMPKILRDSILFQIMQFPVQKELREKDRIPEYVMPQMFMEYAARDGMKGVLYESSKDIKFEGCTKFEELPIRNLCMPAIKPENAMEKYDLNFLRSFFYTTYKAGEPLQDLSVLQKELDECRRLKKARIKTYNMMWSPKVPDDCLSV